MNIIDIIEKKKNKGILTKEEIYYVINSYVKGEIEDYQMSSLLMAICINGMTTGETVDMTFAMKDSGKVLNFDGIFNTAVMDKHSTGGIGDKVTLIVLPILACLGVKIFKMSGRGLGFTGGTIDKLESIKGYCADISIEQAKRLVTDINVCLMSQSDEIAAADKKIYALRDVSGTIDSIPLIAASIMSKKLASGVDKMVLEVTCGTGAFMKDQKEAEKLANLMVDIAKKSGKEAIAIITDMSEPLGRNVGNNLEILEVIDFLNSDYDSLERKQISDLKILTFEIAAQMMKLAGIGDNIRENKNRIAEVIVNKKAYKKFITLIKGQGGYIKSEYLEGLDRSIDIPIMEDIATCKKEMYSSVDGYIEKMNAENIGYALVELGGGRKKKTDKIDHSVGFIFNKKIGDKVAEGESIVTIYFNEKSNIDNAIKYLTEAIGIGNTNIQKGNNILGIIS